MQLAVLLFPQVALMFRETAMLRTCQFEELIAILAGCAAPTGQQTPPNDSRTFSRVEVAAERNIILHVDDEGECCSFLHLEGCANDLDSLQPEALVRESHRLDQDQHSLWSDDSDLQGF